MGYRRKELHIPEVISIAKVLGAHRRAFPHHRLRRFTPLQRRDWPEEQKLEAAGDS
jgi:hypothetical protein